MLLKESFIMDINSVNLGFKKKVFCFPSLKEEKSTIAIWKHMSAIFFSKLRKKLKISLEGEVYMALSI